MSHSTVAPLLAISALHFLVSTKLVANPAAKGVVLGILEVQVVVGWFVVVASFVVAVV